MAENPKKNGAFDRNQIRQDNEKSIKDDIKKINTVLEELSDDSSYASKRLIFSLRKEIEGLKYNSDLKERGSVLSVIYTSNPIIKKLSAASLYLEDVVDTLNTKMVSFSKNMNFDDSIGMIEHVKNVSKTVEDSTDKLFDIVKDQADKKNMSVFSMRSFRNRVAYESEDEIFAKSREGMGKSKLVQEYECKPDTIDFILKDKYKELFAEKRESLVELSKDKGFEDISVSEKIPKERLTSFFSLIGVKDLDVIKKAEEIANAKAEDKAKAKAEREAKAAKAKAEKEAKAEKVEAPVKKTTATAKKIA